MTPANNPPTRLPIPRLTARYMHCDRKWGAEQLTRRLRAGAVSSSRHGAIMGALRDAAVQLRAAVRCMDIDGLPAHESLNRLHRFTTRQW